MEDNSDTNGKTNPSRLIFGTKNGDIPTGFKGFAKEPLNKKAKANNTNANANANNENTNNGGKESEKVESMSSVEPSVELGVEKDSDFSLDDYDNNEQTSPRKITRNKIPK